LRGSPVGFVTSRRAVALSIHPFVQGKPTMKLYYSPGACSLSPHITLHEAGLKFEHIAAPTKTHQLSDGTDYYSINPLGYVPLLELDDGTRLTEGPAIVQYIADQVPDKKLAPANGTIERAKLQSWLNFISTELHKGFSPLFNPATPADYRPMVVEKLMSRLNWVDGELAGKQYLMGDSFSVADPYLFTVTNWAAHVKLDISGFANITAFRARMAARPAVQTAMKDEGLIK
jgi:glutathione S-transferase